MKFSCLQTTAASIVSQSSSHTVPHWLLKQISTLPALDDTLSVSRTSPCWQIAVRCMRGLTQKLFLLSGSHFHSSFPFPISQSFLLPSPPFILNLLPHTPSYSPNHKILHNFSSLYYRYMVHAEISMYWHGNGTNTFHLQDMASKGSRSMWTTGAVAPLPTQTYIACQCWECLSMPPILLPKLDEIHLPPIHTI